MSRMTAVAPVLLIAVAAMGTRPAPHKPQAEAIVLTGVTLIDGTGAAPRPDMSIVIRAGRIVDLFPSSSRSLPAGARVLSFSGKWVIPGLIDAHAHLTSPFVRSGQQDTLTQFLFRGGVTTVRDMAGDAIVLAERARLAEVPGAQTPRIFFSAVVGGPVWQRDSRVATITHGGIVGEVPWARLVDSASDLPRIVREAKATGATGIKIYMDVEPAVVGRLVAEAHRQGMKVWSHDAILPTRPSQAAEAGVDVLSHVMSMVLEGNDIMPRRESWAAAHRYDAVPIGSARISHLLETMKKHGTVFEPTLYAARLRTERSANDTTLAVWRPLAAWGYAFVRRAHAMGIPIVSGTDMMGSAAVDSLPFIHTELELLVTQAGLTPLEAIGTATRNGAEVLGALDSLGTIEKGKLADLLVLDADPTRDIRNTRSIRVVVKSGVGYPRAERTDSLRWRESWPGTQMAVIEGDPFQADSRFTFRFRLPDGYWIRPHTHPVLAHITVISGTLLVGMGSGFDSTAARPVLPGGHVMVAPNHAHFEGARGATVIEVSGTGSWGIKFLRPEDDPARPR
jgi:imidazolonepropionase-like amidohydrolase